MGSILEGKVLNEGNPDCLHDRIMYIDEPFDGQAFWCDYGDCKRHEQIDYSPGDKIKFPVGALITTPNPKYGGEKFYSFRANSEGVAELLPENKWVARRVIEIGSVI